MTPADLLQSVRHRMALGRDLDTAIAELIEEVVADGARLEAAFRAVAPYVIKDLERRTLRQEGQPMLVTQVRRADLPRSADADHSRIVTQDPTVGVPGSALTAHPIGHVHRDTLLLAADGGTDPGSLRPTTPVRSATVSAAPAIPVGNTGRRKPLYDWTARDVDILLHYYGAVRQSLHSTSKAFRDVRQYLEGTRTVRDVWSQLKPETRIRLAAHGGIRMLPRHAS